MFYLRTIWERRFDQSMRLVAVLGIVWVTMAAGDWFMRFHRFRWHDMLVLQNRAIVERGPDTPLTTRTIEPYPGGDLTALTGITEFNRQFEELKPASKVITDEFGYRNQPPTSGVKYPVVIVGDSFMYSAHPADQAFDRQLEAASGIRVYNHAYPGRGPFWSLSRFLVEERFRDRMPALIIWGFIERDISGPAFEGMVYQIWRRNNPDAAATLEPDPTGVNWDRLRPAGLKRNLPDSSLLGVMSTRIWNRLRYLVFRQVTSDVVPSKPLPDGNETLFYQKALEAMAWPPEVRKADRVVWSIEYIRNALQTMGTDLMVVMIPDKEQVYREYIPAHIMSRTGEMPPSVLEELSALLAEKQIPHVNLLPLYRDRADDQSLYWRDDTHWRPEAISMAVDAVILEAKKHGYEPF